MDFKMILVYKMINTKISVVIPVYNVEEYIDQCITSIIEQTMKEIEIVLIDDGSTDSSGRICDEYASKDNRIKVIHCQNKGLSCARNTGIDVSSAPFIMFVDGDDWVEPEFCEMPYKAAIDHDAEMVLFRHNRFCRDGEKKERRETELQEGLLSQSDALNYNVTIANAAWLALYRRQLFDNNRFPEGKYYEDLGIVHRLIHAAGKVYFIDEALYNHRVGRPGSITSSPETKHHHDKIDMYTIRISDLLYWGYDKLAQDLALSIAITFGPKDPFYVNVIRQTQKIKPLQWKMRVLLRIFLLFPRLFDVICIISRKRVKWIKYS